MDILSHTLSGVASASLGVSLLPLKAKEKIKYLILGAFVGAFPDIDAVSMWSKWDSVFHTAQKGSSIYTDKHWYSHHGFFHSLFAGLLLVGFIFLIQKFITKKTLEKKHFWMYGFLILGFVAHLFEDMPTPFSAWGGVRFWFPSEVYVGGFGKIWWWNNYDIFLLILCITVFNIAIGWFKFIPDLMRKMTHVSGTLIFIFLIVFQMNTREFSYENKNEYWDINYMGL